MSTPSVRSAILADIQALVPAGLQVFDLSDYHSIRDLPVNTTQQAFLVDFVAASDRMTTIGGEGNQGWEENGTVALHWLFPTGFASAPSLALCEALRVQLRGKRLTDRVAIESVEPFADSGSPIDIDAGWTAFSSLMFYSRNTCG